ncbi:hypothetical protein HID58_047874 [Brassica napus]|uniref:Uncharacterized protein n=1 Tax=Brassica napus TaxID=3708 RepID=A0ABQ8B0H1_BRANA|nr:hypothetical protein HID58_047874 [Brassica napus]
MAKKKPRQSDVRKTMPYAGLNARALKGSFTINPQPSQRHPWLNKPATSHKLSRNSVTTQTEPHNDALNIHNHSHIAKFHKPISISSLLNNKYQIIYKVI